MRPRIDKCKIQINTYLSVEFDLSIKAFHNGERLLTSHVTLCDVRQLELVLEDISIPRSARIYFDVSSSPDYVYFIIICSNGWKFAH